MATASNPTSTSNTEKVSPTFYIPQSTQDNYLQIARDGAAAAGITPKAALAKLAEDFKRQHDADPIGGWDHLAEWAKTADPGESDGPSALALAQSRAIESARRDPQVSLQGDQAVVAEAIKAITADRGPQAGVGSDPSTGFVANPGPIPVDGPSKD